MNNMKNRKAEFLEIILITISISLGINLISSSIFSLDCKKNIVILTIGVIICFIVVLYYLKIKVKSMNMDKIINGNIILNANNGKIYGILPYSSSIRISDHIVAVILENKRIRKKYNDALKIIKNFDGNIVELQNNYFLYILNSVLEYEILNLLIDHLPLKEDDINIIDLNNASEDIVNNIFIKTLAKDYKKRDIFKNYYDDADDIELYSILSDEGYIYNKFKIAIPKKAKLIHKDNLLIIKSKLFKVSVEWNIEEFNCPFHDMKFYNYFLKDNLIDFNDVEFSYYISVKVEYSLLSMLSKKSNMYYLWIEFIINQLIESFDFKECLKRNHWDLIKNINKV